MIMDSEGFVEQNSGMSKNLDEKAHLLHLPSPKRDPYSRPGEATSAVIDDGVPGVSKTDHLRKICHSFIHHRFMLYGILVGVLCGVQLTAVKLIKSITQFQILFYRGLVYLPCIFFINFGRVRRFERSDWMLSILSGLVNGGALTFAYIALGFANILNVSCIVANQPVPGAILSCLFLGESLTPLSIFIILVNLIGVVLVTKPPLIFQNGAFIDYENEFIGGLFALASVSSFAFSTLTAKILTNRGTIDISLLLVVSGVTGIITCIVEMFASGNFHILPTVSEYLLVACVALCSLLGAAFTIWALQGISFLLVAMCYTLCIPVAFVSGYIFLSEDVDFISIFGAFLAIVSTFCYFLTTSEEDDEETVEQYSEISASP